MSATRKQAELIDKLMERGATMEETDHGNPDCSMYDSVAQADAYIKKLGYLMHQSRTNMRIDEYGGIPNA